MKIGDNVLSLKNPGSLICTLIFVGPKFFVLAPMTKRGWPSVSMRAWEYHHISKFNQLVQAKKHPHLEVCLNCSKGDDRADLLNCGLRRISAFDNKYQCKKCKEIVNYD